MLLDREKLAGDEDAESIVLLILFTVLCVGEEAWSGISLNLLGVTLC
jgi:hypothetical protein